VSVLEQQANFAGYHRGALSIAEARDRLPLPHVIGGDVFNF